MNCKIDPSELSKLTDISNIVRVEVVKMLAQAKSGHPGGSLSMVELIVALYGHCLKYDAHNLTMKGRDRFHLSKGHACPALYAVFSHFGIISPDSLSSLRQYGSLLPGHPHPKTPGIEVASGSLGQGLSVACGMALAELLDKSGAYVYTVLGDGEMQEGQVWEAAAFASHYKLDNLIAIVDCNGLQIDGKVSEIMSIEPLNKRWESFGFTVREIDGHDLEQIICTVEELKQVKGTPKVILAKTVKGKGVSFMEHNLGFHGKAPSSDESEQALGELKGDQKSYE